MPSLAEPARAPLPDALASNGCFETMRAYRGRIFRLEDHLDRLYASAQYLGLTVDGNRRHVAAKLNAALKRSGLREAVVRVALLPRGGRAAQPRPSRSGWSAARGGRAAIPSVVVQRVVLPSATAYRRGVALTIVPTQKFHVGAISPQAKYSARVSSVMAAEEAQRAGALEALFLDALGSVTESTASNFFIVKGGAVVTPPCWLGLLAGITRDVIREVAEALAVPYQEAPLTRHDVYNADEAFLSSTTKELLPVTRIDGRTIGAGRPGPVTGRLSRAFSTLVTCEMRNGRR